MDYDVPVVAPTGLCPKPRDFLEAWQRTRNAIALIRCRGHGVTRCDALPSGFLTALVVSLFDYPLARPASPQWRPPIRQQWLARLLGSLVGGYDGLGGFVAGVVPPVGLHEDGVDLFEIDGFGVIIDGFDEAADAAVFNGMQGAFGDAEDEGGGILGEGAVRESGAVEQGVDVVG